MGGTSLKYSYIKLLVSKNIFSLFEKKIVLVVFKKHELKYVGDLFFTVICRCLP